MKNATSARSITPIAGVEGVSRGCISASPHRSLVPRGTLPLTEMHPTTQQSGDPAHSLW